MISVIIPIYNAEKFLERCLSSILAQSYCNYEVIMVDDGSYDRSANICKKYVQADQRFVYEYKANGGVSSARNYGINICEGQYISFVDADDYVSPLFLERLYNVMQLTKSDVCYCHAHDIDAAGDAVGMAENKSNDSYHVMKPEDYDWMNYEDAHFVAWGGGYTIREQWKIFFSRKISVWEKIQYGFQKS